MTLARRALPEGANVLIIDDFMRQADGPRIELTAEFGASVIGTGVLVETAEPAEKLVHDYVSLAVLDKIDEAAGSQNCSECSVVGANEMLSVRGGV